MKRLWFIVLCTGVLGSVISIPALAKAPGTNGRIVYEAFDPVQDASRYFTINPDGTDPLDVGDLGCIPKWSPDGSKILGTVSTPYGSRPATINPDGSGLTVLDATHDDIDLFCGAWSPDGSRLVYEGGSEDPSVPGGLYSVRASDGGDLTFVAPGACPCDYSPDGTQIVFLGGPTPGAAVGTSKRDHWALSVANTDGTGAHTITPWDFATDTEESWSPDGQWILFAHPGGDLFLVRPDGSGLRQIPLAGAGRQRFRASFPSWAPDGSRIVFTFRDVESGAIDLYTARPDGSDLTQVTDTPGIIDRGADWGAAAS